MQDDNVKSLQTDAGESAVRILFTSIAELNPITSALAKAYYQHMDEKRWRYVEEFFNDVRKCMQDHEDKLHELYDKADPEESLHLMFIAIDKVQFEHQEARRKRYAELFVNSILVGDQITYDEKRMFIQLFGELSDADIILLGKFFQNSEAVENGIPLEIFLHRLTEIVPLVSRLESRGLIFQRFDDYSVRAERWEGSITNFDSRWRNKVYGLTPVGIKFCRFLSGDRNCFFSLLR